MSDDGEDRPARTPGPLGRLPRMILLGLGWLFAGIGIAGLILPGLPGTPFLLLALWLFSKSSQRFHHWLYTHPRFGRSLREWDAHRVIPPYAKVLAVLMMATSLAILFATAEPGSRLPLFIGLALLPVAVWIVTRRSRVPAGDR